MPRENRLEAQQRQTHVMKPLTPSGDQTYLGLNCASMI